MVNQFRNTDTGCISQRNDLSSKLKIGNTFISNVQIQALVISTNIIIINRQLIEIIAETNI